MSAAASQSALVQRLSADLGEICGLAAIEKGKLQTVGMRLAAQLDLPVKSILVGMPDDIAHCLGDGERDTRALVILKAPDGGELRHRSPHHGKQARIARHPELKPQRPTCRGRNEFRLATLAAHSNFAHQPGSVSYPF